MESDHTEEASVQGQFRHLIEFAQSALTAENRAEFAERAVLEIASMMRSRAVLLYLLGAESGVPRLFRYGLENEDDRYLMEMCERGLEVLGRGGAPAIDSTSRGGISLTFLPLEVSHARVGLLGVEISKTAWPDWTNKLITLVEAAIGRYDQQAKTEKRLAQLNAYLTVSSMLGQSIGVQDQLEAALYCCMDAVSAEAGSVLLLDDEKKSFVFYQVEGPKKPILKSATFPADTGLAGAILRSGQSEIIHDVAKDPRFYRAIDAESGFETKNMIAIPLTADGEAIGILEVLNKAGSGSFTEEEHQLLRCIADEIAFAIRNAKLFEYAANSYCRQRQGQASCHGCIRPLGAWTPCVKYRQIGL